ncbi:MAG TPA: metalloregulator ArsR/SmtB family transcription factor [Planctomycetota bacterium]|nr:metalloregulator ArsR/SmtB family transcription factor [Planctomycetota bacterium]
MPDLAATTDLLRLLSDPTRLRLLSLLAAEQLTVAELTGATRLVQSRVSTHLSRLREAGLLRLRRAGASTYYALDDAHMGDEARRLWSLLSGSVDDAILAEDRRRLRESRAARRGTWADGVAGSMERHYSPGRTWEAAARCLVGLARQGEVLDIASGDGALAELVAPRARRVTCLDRSVHVATAGRRRVQGRIPVEFVAGDMHALPLRDAAFDAVLLANSLSYAQDPPRAVAEAVRVLRPGGMLVATALRSHGHQAVAEAFDHVQAGFQPSRLRALFERAGCEVSFCEVTSRERRPPHFEVVTLYAARSAP